MMYLGKQWSQPDHISSVGPCTWGLSSPSQSSSSQLVRSSYMMLFATQNKSATEQEGDRKLSADRIWAKCCGKIHELHPVLHKAKVPRCWKNIKIAHYLYFSLYLIEMAILLSHLLPGLFIEIQKGPCFSNITSPSLPQNIKPVQEAQNLARIKHTLYE